MLFVVYRSLGFDLVEVHSKRGLERTDVRISNQEYVSMVTRLPTGYMYAFPLRYNNPIPGPNPSQTNVLVSVVCPNGPNSRPRYYKSA